MSKNLLVKLRNKIFGVNAVLAAINDLKGENSVSTKIDNDQNQLKSSISEQTLPNSREKSEKESNLKASVNLVAQDWVESPYYELAEDWLNFFWSSDSPFKKLFQSLEMGVVLELACGEGRNSQQIVNQASQLILMDVNEPNIKACKHRFQDYNHVQVIQNNGYNLQPLATNSVDSIFCYDAMVHFEMNIVESYLKDCYRVLKPNGKALFHHSNLTDYPGNHYKQNPHWRNFMSKEIFAHLAKRSGFEVLEQIVIDWGEGEEHYSNLDCITLVSKNS